MGAHSLLWVCIYLGTCLIPDTYVESYDSRHCTSCLTIVMVKATGAHLLYGFTIGQGNIIWWVLDGCVSSLIPRAVFEWKQGKSFIGFEMCNDQTTKPFS